MNITIKTANQLIAQTLSNVPSDVKVEILKALDHLDSWSDQKWAEINQN